MLEAYQRWLHHHRKGNGAPLSVRTQLSRLSYLRSFYGWLEKRELLPDNPAAKLQENGKEPHRE
jgi:integrase/recombinase XerD